MDEFPTEQELAARYRRESELTPQQETILEQPYYTSQNTYPPRYYQRIAINRTVDAIAQGQQRILLVMATGTGKTYTAFQIVYRMLQSGMKRKILYLADRNILVDQSKPAGFIKDGLHGKLVMLKKQVLFGGSVVGVFRVDMLECCQPRHLLS